MRRRCRSEGAPDDSSPSTCRRARIVGLVVPWDRIATRNGRKFRFARGSLDVLRHAPIEAAPRPSPVAAVGRADLRARHAGWMVGTWRIAAGPAGMLRWRWPRTACSTGAVPGGGDPPMGSWSRTRTTAASGWSGAHTGGKRR